MDAKGESPELAVLRGVNVAQGVVRRRLSLRLSFKGNELLLAAAEAVASKAGPKLTGVITSTGARHICLQQNPSASFEKLIKAFLCEDNV